MGFLFDLISVYFSIIEMEYQVEKKEPFIFSAFTQYSNAS